MEQIAQMSRCMWCGASKVEVHHQYVLPICNKCVDDFRKED